MFSLRSYTLEVSKNLLVFLPCFSAVALSLFISCAPYETTMDLTYRALTSSGLIKQDKKSLLQIIEKQIQDVKYQKGEFATYQAKVEAKLNQIAVIINSASELGLLGEDKPEVLPANTENVGGAEIDCTLRDCAPRNSVQEALADFQLGQKININNLNQEEIVFLLNSYRNIIRKLPIDNPAPQGRISSHYGYRKSPFSGHRSLHKGMDIALAHGSEIKAPAYGKASAVKYSKTYGRTIDIEHSPTITTRYAHLSKALIQPGQEIKKNQVIGLAGSSGKSTGTHLHYEILLNGKAINPKKFMELQKSFQVVF